MHRMRMWLLILAVLCATRTVGAEDVVPSDRRLPKQVLGYVSLRSVAELKTHWSKTSLGRLGEEPALAEFWTEISAAYKKVSAKIESEYGVSLEDLLSTPQGEVAFAAVQPPGQKVSLVALVDFGDKRETLDKLLEKAIAALEEQGLKHSEDEQDDARIHLFKKPADEENKKRPAGYFDTIAYCLKDSFLLAGTSAEAIKSVLTRWDGKHEQIFAETEVYRYIVERGRDDVQSPPMMTWYLDPVGLVKGVLTTMQPVSLQTTMALSMVPQLGLDKLRAIGGTLDVAVGEYDEISRTLIYMEQPPTGVLNLFQFPATNLAPPKWISAQTSTFYAVNWDIAKAYDAVEKLVDTFQGAGSFARTVDSVAETEELGNLHPKKDVIDLLTGKVQIMGDFRDAADAGTQRYLFALEVKNTAAFKSTLSKVAKIPGFPGKFREFQGEPVYEFPLPAADEEEKAGRPTAVGIAVAEGHFLIATDVTLLEDVLRGNKTDETLADAPAYRKLAAKFPAQTSWISFQKQDAQVKELYEMLRTGKADELFGDDEEFKVDFSKLPPFDVVKKYLPATAGYAVPDERGLLLIDFTLRSEKD